MQTNKTLLDVEQEKFQVVCQIYDLTHYSGKSCVLP